MFLLIIITTINQNFYGLQFSEVEKKCRSMCSFFSHFVVGFFLICREEKNENVDAFVRTSECVICLRATQWATLDCGHRINICLNKKEIYTRCCRANSAWITNFLNAFTIWFRTWNEIKRKYFIFDMCLCAN